jgi:hypothetical protein
MNEHNGYAVFVCERFDTSHGLIILLISICPACGHAADLLKSIITISIVSGHSFIHASSWHDKDMEIGRIAGKVPLAKYLAEGMRILGM